MTPERPIYLDYNATTPVLPEVVDAMLPCLREHFGNPSSSHVYGQRAKNAVESAREQVATLIGARPDEIVFTASGTESNNLAIRGVAQLGDSQLITSVIEHPAVSSPHMWLDSQRRRVTWIPVDIDGRVELSAVEKALLRGTALVSIMHSNNETGVLQPIKEIAGAAHRHDVLVHTDAAQSVGKVAIDVNDLGVDLLTIAGHKLYAPKGVGALYVRRGTEVLPLMLGASHERGKRAGTENVASIVGLGAACNVAKRDLDVVSARLTRQRDRFWNLLSERIPNIKLNGHTTERLPNTLNIQFPGASATRLLSAATGVAASAGSACHEGHETPSAVLLAMGVSVDEALSSVRLSLGRMTTDADLELAADKLAEARKAVG